VPLGKLATAYKWDGVCRRRCSKHSRTGSTWTRKPVGYPLVALFVDITIMKFHSTVHGAGRLPALSGSNNVTCGGGVAYASPGLRKHLREPLFDPLADLGGTCRGSVSQEFKLHERAWHATEP
jgi:hypothetical protein